MGNQHTLFLKGLASAATPGTTTFDNSDFSEEYVNALGEVVNHYYGPGQSELKAKHADKVQEGTLDYSMVNDYFGLDTVFEDYNINTIGDEIKTTLGQAKVRRDGDKFIIDDVYDFSNVGGLSSIPGKIAGASSFGQAIYDTARTIGGVVMPENPDGSSKEDAARIQLTLPAIGFSEPESRFNVDNPEPMPRPDRQQTTLVGRETPEVKPEPVELEDKPQPIDNANPVPPKGEVERRELEPLPEPEPEAATPVPAPGAVERRELDPLPEPEPETATPVPPRGEVEVRELGELPEERKAPETAPAAQPAPRQQQVQYTRAPAPQTQAAPEWYEMAAQAAFDLSQPDALQAVVDLYDPQPTDTPAPANLGEVFGAGVAAGNEQVVADLNYLAALGNAAIGDEEGRDSRLRTARLFESISGDAMSGIQEFGDFLEEPTFSGFFEQVVSSIGQVTPNALGTITTAVATGGVAALAQAGGTALLRNGGTQVIKKMVNDSAAKLGRGEVFDTVEKEFMDATYDYMKTFRRGAIGGAFASEYPQITGQIGAELDDADVEITAERALGAFLGGVPLSAVGVAGETVVANAILKMARKKAVESGQKGIYAEFAENVGKLVVGGGLTEAGTELVQEGAMVGLRNVIDPNYTAEQSQLRLAQAAFSGFFAGAGIAGPGAAVSSTLQAANRMVERKNQAFANAKLNQEEFNSAGTAPESIRDLSAQINAAADPNSPKQAAWIPARSGSVTEIDSQIESDNTTTQVQTPDGKTVFAARIPGAGTIISASKDVVDSVVMGNASEAVLADALGYSAGRPTDADRVVRVRDANGNIIHEEATNEAGMKAAVVAAERIAGTTGSIDTVSPQQALKDRKARYDEEQTREMQFDEQEARDAGMSIIEEDDAGLPVEEQVADFAIPRTETRNPDFDERFQRLLDAVPVERIQEFQDLKDSMSDSALNFILDAVENDPEFEYFFTEVDGRLAVARIQTGLGMESGNVRDAVQFVIQNSRKLDKRKPRFLNISMPDGSTIPTTLPILVGAGRRLNVRSREGLVGDGMNEVQSARQGLIRIMKELAQRGYVVNLRDGRPLTLTPADLRTADTTSARAMAAAGIDGLPSITGAGGRSIGLAEIIGARDPQPRATPSEQRRAVNARKAGERAVQKFDRARERRRAELIDDNVAPDTIEDILAREFPEATRQQIGRDAAKDYELSFDPDRIPDIQQSAEEDGLQNPEVRAQQEAMERGVFEGEMQDIRAGRLANPNATVQVNRQGDVMVTERTLPTQEEAQRQAAGERVNPTGGTQRQTIRQLSPNQEQDFPDSARPNIYSRILIEDMPTPQGTTTRAPNRQQRRASKKAPSVVVNNGLPPIAGRILGTAMKLFSFSKTVHVISLSDLKANQAKYTEGKYANIAGWLEATVTRMDENPTQGRYLPTEDAHVIVINDTNVEAGTATDALLGTVLAHEVGHIVFQEEYDNLMAGPRNEARRKMLWEAFKKHLENMDTIPDQYDLTKEGFEEWYADQVAAYVYDKSKSAKTGADSYFKSIAKKLRDFFTQVNRMLGGRVTQDATFAEYMDGVVAAHTANRKSIISDSDGRVLGMVEKIGIREMVQEIQAQEWFNSFKGNYQQLTQRIMRSPTYKWFSKWLATTDGYLRALGPAGEELAKFFYNRSQSLEETGFHQAKTVMFNRFVSELGKVFGLDITADEKTWADPEIEEALLLAEDETVTDADLAARTDDAAKKAVRVRKLFSRIFDTYITNKDTGNPWFAIRKRQNYAPRMLDFVAIEANPEGFIEFLRQQGVDQGRINLIMESLGLSEMSEDITNDVQQDGELTPEEQAMADRKARLSPGMDQAAARALQDIPTSVLRENGFLVPPGLAMIQYFHQVTRKVEFERRGGFDRIANLIDQLPEEEQGFVDTIVQGNLGKRGQGMSSHWRTFNSIAAVHTVATTLLFTVFASVTDLAGVATRMKEFDNLQDYWKEALHAGRESVRKGGRFDRVYDWAGFESDRERIEFARDVGVVSMEALDNMFISVGELDFADAWARKAMSKFFDLTGLQWYTRATRIFATKMGEKFIIRSATKENFGPREERYLSELGLTREQVLENYNAETETLDLYGPNADVIAKAIARFAEEAIIRPNPAERPSWANNPYLTAVWQLKSYFYAYGKTVIGGIGREINNRYSEDGNFEGGAQVALLAAAFMIPLTMLGLEMREYTKWTMQALVPGIEASGRVFRSDYMDTGEYMWEIFERSGVLGPLSIGVTTVESLQWEGALGPVISNIPFIDAFDDTFIDGDWNRPIPVLNNIQ